MFCYSLAWRFRCWIFPVRIPAGRNLPGELGRIGTATGEEAIFAKGCFRSQVAGWSPKTEDRSRFLMDCLALLDFVSWSVNPQVVGSSPTRGAILVPKTLRFRDFFVSILFILPKIFLFYALLWFLKKLGFYQLGRIRNSYKAYFVWKTPKSAEYQWFLDS